MKVRIIEETHYFPGIFVDDHTFVDSHGKPYELKTSTGAEGSGPSEDPTEKPKVRVNNKTGKREVYLPQMKVWREI